MTSGAGLYWLDTLPLVGPLPSLPFEPAGVSGGDCTAPAGGEPLGEGSPEPAAMLLLFGVAVPDAT